MMAPFLAKPGQGKTLSMVTVLLDDYLRGLDIMSNLRLTFPKERGAGKIRKLDVPTLADPRIELENLTVGLDELWLWIDSRRSSSRSNVTLNRLFLQSRKRDMNVLGTGQGFSQFDVRFRENVDLVFLCRKLNLDGARIFDPLWSDPEGIIEATPYLPTGDEPVGSPLRLRMGGVFPLYDHKQIFEVVEIEA